EVTNRTITYYFDDTVAKIVEEPRPEEPRPEEPKPEEHKVSNAPAVPEPTSFEIRDQEVLELGTASITPSAEIAAEPPPLLKPIKSVESAAKPATDNTDAATLITAETQLSLGHQ